MTWIQTIPTDLALQMRIDRMEDPDRLDATLRLAQLNGWYLSALARAVGVSRQVIDQRLLRWGSSVAGARDLPIPSRPPNRPSLKPRRQALKVKTNVAEQLREMYAIARTVRGWTPLDDPARQINLEFTETLARLNRQGVSYATLAEALDCSLQTVVFRLRRHGYKHNPPSQKTYRGIFLDRSANAKRRRKDFCLRGHERIPENLYPSGKCKPCAQKWQRDYYARQKQVS